MDHNEWMLHSIFIPAFRLGNKLIPPRTHMSYQQNPCLTAGILFSLFALHPLQAYDGFNPMDDELRQRLDAQDATLNNINASLNRIRAYFKWTFIIMIVVIVLPLIGMLFAIPSILSSYSTMYSGF